MLVVSHLISPTNLNTSGTTDTAATMAIRTIRHDPDTLITDSAPVVNGSFEFGDQKLDGDVSYEVTVSDGTDTDIQDVFITIIKPGLHNRRPHQWAGHSDGAHSHITIDIHINKTARHPMHKVTIVRG